MFSLRDTIARVDDEGVTFRSVYDGAEAQFTPELAARIQAEPRQRHRDVPRPGAAGRASRGAQLEEAVRRTTLWAARQRDAPRADGQLRFGIAQGGVDPELRRRSTEEIAELDFDGNAIGGLAIGEDRDAMFEATDRSAALMPADKPRYFMGIGDPEGILEVIEAGVDMFDCVLPTRTARTGSALTWEGRLNLRNARFARDQAPDRRALRLPGLRRASRRAYVRHLVNQNELLGPAPALAAQSTLPDQSDPRRAHGDRARRVRLLQARLLSKGSCERGRIPARRPGARRRSGSSSSSRSRRRQRSHAAMQDSVEVGDEIITAGGLHAVVLEDDGDELQVEIAPGVVVDARSPGGRGGGPRDRGRGRARR